MTCDNEFGPLAGRPKNWADVLAITQGVTGISIAVIEQGRLDWEYNFGSADMRPCGRDGCEQDHGHGWVVAIAGKSYVNIGNDCAHRYAHAETWQKKLTVYRGRERADARAQAIVMAREAAQQKLYWLDTTPEIEQAISLHDSFASQAQGPLYLEIEKRAEKGLTRIEREVTLSDEERSARQVMLAGFRAEDKPAPYVAATEHQLVAEIGGLECFRRSRSPKHLRSRLQQLVKTLLTSLPADEDGAATRSLMEATRELAPLSNQLNTSLKATHAFFSDSNLRKLMHLGVIKRQGIVAIVRNGPDQVQITRRAHWNRSAA